MATVIGGKSIAPRRLRGRMRVNQFPSLFEAGGTLTVTPPDITRCLVTRPGACQLADGIRRPSEVLILDFVEPVKILDVARRMIVMPGQLIDTKFPGLRLHKELIAEGEHGERPFPEKSTHPRVHALDADSPMKVERYAYRAGEAEAITPGGFVDVAVAPVPIVSAVRGGHGAAW